MSALWSTGLELIILLIQNTSGGMRQKFVTKRIRVGLFEDSQALKICLSLTKDYPNYAQRRVEILKGVCKSVRFSYLK